MSPWMSWQLSRDLFETEEKVKNMMSPLAICGVMSDFMISKWVCVPLFMKDTGANDTFIVGTTIKGKGIAIVPV